VLEVRDRLGVVPESQVERVGRYELLAELGQGAMGVVYRAHDPQLGRTVALKTLRRDLALPPEQYADLKKRFYQEATAAGRLNHPNLVAVHDVVELDDIPYMVMEYVEGQTLAHLIAAEGSLSPERAVSLIVQVCRALHYAHARGVVHRDIKPGNILVDGSGQAKVSDFGIARISGSDVTQTGALLGTPAYMSPEQLNGRVVDGRSDLFSLTVALYEAVTGVNPFKADDIVAVLARIATATPAPARERNPAVSPALDAVLARGMAKHPTGRYENAQALADALARALERPGEVVPAPGTPAGARPPRRWLRMALGAAAALVALGVGTAAAWDWWWYQRFGSIVVNSNSAVEVFVDGEFKGRTGDGPLVLPDVSVGQRVVTLRLGPRQWEHSGPVRRDEPLALSYRFPEERPAVARPREAPARPAASGPEPRRDAAGKIKDALDKPREAFEQFRGTIEKLLKSQ
jgi:Protein kinase domain